MLLVEIIVILNERVKFIEMIFEMCTFALTVRLFLPSTPPVRSMLHDTTKQLSSIHRRFGDFSQCWSESGRESISLSNLVCSPG